MQWQVVDEGAGLWSAEYRIPSLPCRSSAIRLPSGGYLVLSPGAQLASGFADELGVAELLLAPNSFHHMGVTAWQEAFPAAVVAAAPAAHKRLAKQGRTGLSDLAVVREALPEHVGLLEPPGSRIGEVWLRVQGEDGVIWCVGDSFFNLPRLSKRLGVRLLQKVLRSAPGLRLSNLMKWGGLKSRGDFKRWVLEQLDADQPIKIVVLHGDVAEDDVASRLRELIQSRL